MGVCRFGCTPPGTNFAVAGTKVVSGSCGDRQVRKAVGWIERRVLIGAIAERVLQIVIHSEAGANHSAIGVAERTPGDPDAGLRQELGIVLGESGRADIRLGVDDAVGERVGGSAAIHFIPSGGKFVAEAERERKPGRQADHVFGVERAKQRPPAERRGRGIVQERADGALQKCLQAGEGGLPVLAQRKFFVGLQSLEPGAERELIDGPS